jgi:DNA-binding beta-propeller fold protein YncE
MQGGAAPVPAPTPAPTNRVRRGKVSVKSNLNALLGLAAACGVALSLPAFAEIMVVASDHKLVLENGMPTVVQHASADTVAVVDIGAAVPRQLAVLEVPNSAIGPPLSVAVTPDERLALVTAAMKIDPNDAGEQVPDNRVSVIDLAASPPKILGTVAVGAGASGVGIAPNGRLALVADRFAGSVSVLRMDGTSVVRLDTVDVGNVRSGVSAVAVSPDGKAALVTRTGDNTVSVLSIDGEAVRYTGQDIAVGPSPYGLVIAPNGRAAVVANVGTGHGTLDTLSVIDMSGKPLRVASTITVGATPEGIALSPNGLWCAIVLLNGTNTPKGSASYHPKGKVVLFRLDGLKLTRIDDAPVGAWPQGAAFSADNRRLMVESMVERSVRILEVSRRGTLKDTGNRILLDGGGAAMRTAEHGGT